MISDLLPAEFNQFLAAHTGLYFGSKEKRKQLLKGIEKAAGEFGFNDPAKCIQWLMPNHLSREQIEILGSHLTVTETYFFREQKSFEVPETKIPPELIRSRHTGAASGRRLRIWSAARCSRTANGNGRGIDRRTYEGKGVI
jgi:chemotaxis protein methyltransferase CheR